MVVGAALAVLGLPQEAVPASLAVLPPSVFDSDIPQADRDSVLASSANDPELELAKLADGCRHVFVDAGANIGMHARFLFEPELYPLSSFTRKFDEHFGTAEDRRSNVCAIEFEPNPAHRNRHQALSQAYSSMG